MKFFTELKIPPIKAEQQIDYQSNIISLGSCFAQNMAEKLQMVKFRVWANPFGILFNPHSIENIVQRAVNQEFFSEKDLIYYNDIWQSFQVHSSCSEISKEKILTNLNQKLSDFNKKIKEATHFIITLGTAWVYVESQTEQIVANCHKIPQKFFKKKLLQFDDIFKNLKNLTDLIRSQNSDIQLIFTISPVRHLKDGFVENQRSKSLLISALHSFLEEENSDKNHYFPSYEILMDELRDYRFYADDLLHPSSMATDYIWEKFKEIFVKNSTFSLIKEIQNLQKSLEHRPLNFQSQAYEKFEQSTQQKKKLLEEKYPWLKF